jgi:hypothetical protein
LSFICALFYCILAFQAVYSEISPFYLSPCVATTITKFAFVFNYSHIFVFFYIYTSYAFPFFFLLCYMRVVLVMCLIKSPCEKMEQHGWYPRHDYLLWIQLLAYSPLTQGCFTYTLNKSFSQLISNQNDLLIINTPFSFLGLDPQKIQIFFILWVEDPSISTLSYTLWMYGLNKNEMKCEKIL